MAPRAGDFVSGVAGVVPEPVQVVFGFILGLLYVPLQWLWTPSEPGKTRTERKKWKARRKQLLTRLKNANSYEQWHDAATALDQHIPKLRAWKADPQSEEYDWESIEQTTAEMRQANQLWVERRQRDIQYMRRLFGLMQARDVGRVTNPTLYGHLFSGTKRLIEDFVQEAVRGVDIIRNRGASGPDSHKQKNDWFKGRRKVHGKTALFVQGGSIFSLVHLGVIKALFQTGILPEIIVGTETGALVATLIASRTDEELDELFNADGGSTNLEAFRARSAHRRRTWYGGAFNVCRRLFRAWNNESVLDRSTLARCVRDNVGDMTFEEAFRRTGRKLCILLTSDAPSTPNCLSHITAPNVLIRSAAIASMVPDPDRCLDEVLEVNYQRRIAPWALNDESPEYRRRRRAKGWPGQKPAIYRVIEIHNITHFVMPQSRPYIVPFLIGTQSRAIHGTGRARATLEFGLSAIIVLLRIGLALLYRLRGLNTPGRFIRAEDAIPAKRRVKPFEIAPTMRWADFWRFWRNPTEADLQYWMRKGEQATWPVLPALHVRMDLEMALNRQFDGDREKQRERDDIMWLLDQMDAQKAASGAKKG